MSVPPSFSIVTPSYNQCRYLARTMESVLSQAGEFTIDYIVADGGSTDDSVDIIRRIEQRLQNGSFPLGCRGATLRWWSRKDAGQSDAINQGFRAATGDVVAWINSDDVYREGAFRGAAAALQANASAGMVYSNLVVIDADDREIERHRGAPFDMEFQLNEGNLVAQPTVFVRRTALERTGLLDPRYHYAMDYDLWLRVAKAFPVVYVDEWWAAFRMHGASKTVALADRFWREEREIARRHGGRFLSRMLVEHLADKWPVPMKYVLHAANATRLARRGELRELAMRLQRRLRPSRVSE